MSQLPVPDSKGSPVTSVPKFLYLNLACSRFDGVVERWDVLVGIFANEKISSPLRAGFCVPIFVKSVREPLWIKVIRMLMCQGI